MCLHWRCARCVGGLADIGFDMHNHCQATLDGHKRVSASVGAKLAGRSSHRSAQARRSSTESPGPGRKRALRDRQPLRPSAAVADARLVQRSRSPADAGDRVPSGDVDLLGPLARFDFSNVRLHHDAEADQLATAASAVAFTVGRHIFFRHGAYAPHNSAGRLLLRHELVHAEQNRAHSVGNGAVLPVSSPHDVAEREAAAIASGRVGGRPSVSTQPPALRRVLAAYSREHTERMPRHGFSGVSFTSSSDASRIRAALAALISAGRVVVDTIGDRDFFSLPAAGAATLADVEAALVSGGLPRPHDLAVALADAHNANLFAGTEIVRVHSLMFALEIARNKDTLGQTDRPLTAAEASEARRVFAGGLDYSAVRITEDPLIAAYDTARTLPGSIYFPPGASRNSTFMPLLIHELTHIWQYQHGTWVAHTATTAMLTWMHVQTYSFGGEAGLLAASAAGEGLSSFNTEQQGDIVSSYYERTVSGQSTTAWAPFIAEIRKPP